LQKKRLRTHRASAAYFGFAHGLLRFAGTHAQQSFAHFSRFRWVCVYAFTWFTRTQTPCGSTLVTRFAAHGSGSCLVWFARTTAQAPHTRASPFSSFGRSGLHTGSRLPLTKHAHAHHRVISGSAYTGSRLLPVLLGLQFYLYTRLRSPGCGLTRCVLTRLRLYMVSPFTHIFTFCTARFVCHRTFPGLLLPHTRSLLLRSFHVWVGSTCAHSPRAHHALVSRLFAVFTTHLCGLLVWLLSRTTFTFAPATSRALRTHCAVHTRCVARAARSHLAHRAPGFHQFIVLGLPPHFSCICSFTYGFRFHTRFYLHFCLSFFSFLTVWIHVTDIHTRYTRLHLSGSRLHTTHVWFGLRLFLWLVRRTTRSRSPVTPFGSVWLPPLNNFAFHVLSLRTAPFRCLPRSHSFHFHHRLRASHAFVFRFVAGLRFVCCHFSLRLRSFGLFGYVCAFTLAFVIFVVACLGSYSSPRACFLCLRFVAVQFFHLLYLAGWLTFSRLLPYTRLPRGLVYGSFTCWFTYVTLPGFTFYVYSSLFQTLHARSFSHCFHTLFSFGCLHRVCALVFRTWFTYYLVFCAHAYTFSFRLLRSRSHTGLSRFGSGLRTVLAHLARYLPHLYATYVVGFCTYAVHRATCTGCRYVHVYTHGLRVHVCWLRCSAWFIVCIVFIFCMQVCIFTRLRFVAHSPLPLLYTILHSTCTPLFLYGSGLCAKFAFSLSAHTFCTFWFGCNSFARFAFAVYFPGLNILVHTRLVCGLHFAGFRLASFFHSRTWFSRHAFAAVARLIVFIRRFSGLRIVLLAHCLRDSFVSVACTRFLRWTIRI